MKWWQSKVRHHFSNMVGWRVLPVFVESIEQMLVLKNIPDLNLSARAIPRVIVRTQLPMAPTFHISTLKLHGHSKKHLKGFVDIGLDIPFVRVSNPRFSKVAKYRLPPFTIARQE